MTFTYSVRDSATDTIEYVSLTGDEQAIYSWLLDQYGAGNVHSVQQEAIDQGLLDTGKVTHLGSIDSEGNLVPPGSDTGTDTTTGDYDYPDEPFETEVEAGFAEEFLRHLGTLGPKFREPSPRRTARVAEAQYAPLRGLFAAQQLGSTAPLSSHTGQTAWEAFLKHQTGAAGFPSVVGGKGGQGVTSWRELERLAGHGKGAETLTEAQKRAFWPEEMEWGMPAARAGTALAASAMSPLVYRQFGMPTASDLARSYQSQRVAGDQPDSFIEFLRRQLGLGGVGGAGLGF